MGPNFDAIHPTVAEIWVSAARGGVFILRAVGKTVKPHPEWVNRLSVFGFGARGLSHLPNRTVRPSVRSVDRAVGKQARKNCLFTMELREIPISLSPQSFDRLLKKNMPGKQNFVFASIRVPMYRIYVK
jgi:hypothetical protein